jgi:hypothetical protein
MLFQAYTSGRLAEFVHSSKGKASEDPLGEREETNKNAHHRKAAHCDYDDDSDAGADDEPELAISVHDRPYLFKEISSLLALPCMRS